MRSARSGSDTRQRITDVRIRLNEEEIAAFDSMVAQAGFRGQHARGDWLRAQIGCVPKCPALEHSNHQRVPLPGGQALLAGLGKAGTDLRKLTNLVPAFIHGQLDDANQTRVENEILPWIEQALRDVTAAVERVDEHLDRLAPRQ